MKIVHYISFDSFDTAIFNFDPMIFHNESWCVMTIDQLKTYRWT